MLRAGPACHSIELARSGAEVLYAVESEEAMVEYARSKAVAEDINLQLILGDMENFQLPVRQGSHPHRTSILGLAGLIEEDEVDLRSYAVMHTVSMAFWVL